MSGTQAGQASPDNHHVVSILHPLPPRVVTSWVNPETKPLVSANLMESQKIVRMTIRQGNFNVIRGVPAAVELFLPNRQIVVIVARHQTGKKCRKGRCEPVAAIC
jgi:hypothetical protein